MRTHLARLLGQTRTAWPSYHVAVGASGVVLCSRAPRFAGKPRVLQLAAVFSLNYFPLGFFPYITSLETSTHHIEQEPGNLINTLRQ